MVHFVVATFKFKDKESLQACKDIMATPDGIAKTRSFPGNINIKVYQADDVENTLVIFQNWASKDCHAAYLKMRTEEGLLGKIAETLREPLEIVHMTSVGV
jgi:quinol monooxygenase YgiN